MIDLMRCLADNPRVSIQARRMGDAPGVEMAEDKASITLGFEDGSFGTIMYLANGASTFPKERVEVFTAGRTLQLANFRRLTGFGWPGFKQYNPLRPDQGQQACPAAFLASRGSGPAAATPAATLVVSPATIRATLILRAHCPNCRRICA